MTTEMAKKPDKGQTGEPIDQNQAGTSPKLRLVPPINHTPNTSLPPDIALIPSSDLTLLLSDPTILKRYRAGRYKQGTNTSLKVSWTSEISPIATHICGQCSPRCSIDTITSLAIHVSVLDMIEWTSVRSLSSTHDTYARSIPTISLPTVHLVQSLLAITFRPIGASRSVVIPNHVDEDLSRVAAVTGISKCTLGMVGMAHTLSSQPHRYLNKRMVKPLSELVREVRHWLRWKAGMLETAIEEFERYETEAGQEEEEEG